MKGAFWRLLRKEARQVAPVALGIVAVVVGWHLFLYTRVDRWPNNLVTGLAAVPLGFVPLWMYWRSVATMRQEWTGNHMYLLLSLPVPGWYIAASKVLIVMAEAIVYTVVIGGGSLTLVWAAGWLKEIPIEAFRPSPGFMALVLGAALLSPLAVVIVTQFSYIASRIARRFTGLVAAVVFVLSVWFIVRVGTVLSQLFEWLPDVTLSANAISSGVVVNAGLSLSIAPAVGSILAVAALFWATATLLERDIEL